MAGRLRCRVERGVAQACPPERASRPAPPIAPCCRLATGPALPAATRHHPDPFTQGAERRQAGPGQRRRRRPCLHVGIPGTGKDAPLTFDCTDGNLASNAAQVGSGHRRQLHRRGRERPVHQPQPLSVPDAKADARQLRQHRRLRTEDAAGARAGRNPDPAGQRADPDVNLRIAPGTTSSDFRCMSSPRTTTGRPRSRSSPPTPRSATRRRATSPATASGKSRLSFNGRQGDGGRGGADPGCVGDCNGNDMVVINELDHRRQHRARQRPRSSACPHSIRTATAEVEINELIASREQRS